MGGFSSKITRDFVQVVGHRNAGMLHKDCCSWAAVVAETAADNCTHLADQDIFII